jgi:hypothetical protein
VLSDDIFRYVWDGRVQHAGVNPYLHPPEARELALLRDEVYEGINNKDIETLYPPLLQMVFFLATAVSSSVLWTKICFVLVDLALVFLLTHLASSPIRALVYAWSPLAVVEVAGSGHNDVLGAFLLIAALLASDRGRPAVTVALLTASGLAKLLGLALAPLFARVVGLRHFAVVPVVGVLVAAPYASAGALAFRGLVEYGSRWRANDSLFHLLFAVTGSLDTAKVVVGAMLVLMTVVLVLRRTPPRTACFLVVSAVLLLSPTVHPWYLLWALPFLSLFPSPAWMFLSVSIGLSYHAAYLASPGAPWEELLWVKALEYVPFYGLLLASALGKLGTHDTRSTP